MPPIPIPGNHWYFLLTGAATILIVAILAWWLGFRDACRAIGAFPTWKHRRW
jgi:hypothetical protein